MKGRTIFTLDDETYELIVEEAMVDCRDEYEQIICFCCALQDEVSTPISVKIVGLTFQLTGFTSDDSRVLATIERDGKSTSVDLREVEVVRGTDKESLDWIVAYQKWRKGW